jgi:DNA-binding transcriptional MerR regulator
MVDVSELVDGVTFKIGELAKMLKVEPYVLRYWETEFPELQPDKTRSGQRVYNHKDVVLLLKIKSLLYDDLYTIAGARRQLELQAQGHTPPLHPDTQASLATLHAQLDALSQELQSLTQREQELLNHIQSLTSSNFTLTAQLHDAHQQLDRLSAELSSERARSAQLLDRADQEVAQESRHAADLIALRLENTRLEELLRSQNTRELALKHQQQHTDQKLQLAQDSLEQLRSRRALLQDHMRQHVHHLVALAS